MILMSCDSEVSHLRESNVNNNRAEQRSVDRWWLFRTRKGAWPLSGNAEHVFLSWGSCARTETRLRVVHSGTIVLAILLCSCDRWVSAQEESAALDRARYANLSAAEFALLEEYHGAYQELKGYYQNASMSIRATEFRLRTTDDGLPVPTPNSELVPASLMQCDYQSREGKYFRLDGKLLEQDGQTPQELLTGIVRPEESFLLGQDRATGKYFLKAHGKNREEYLGVLQSYVFPVAPFASFSGLLMEYDVFSPRSDKRLDSIVQSVESGEPVVTIVVSTQNERGTVVKRTQLLRKRHWAVSRIDGESSTRSSSGTLLTRNLQICEYEGEPQGFPALKRVLQESRSGYEGDKELVLRRRSVIDVTRFVPGPSEERVFEVKSLIPGFDRVGVKGVSSRLNWLLALQGVLLVVLGIWFSRRRPSRLGAG